MVKGKVQGVFFRASAKQKAIDLELTGWIKNTPDGFVECMASGEQEAVQQFIQWCKSGPKGALVSAVETTLVAERSYAGFSIVR